MSKLREKLALDATYLNDAPDIQLDTIIFPYLEQVATLKANEIGFQFSGAVVDEIYKDLIANYGLSINSTLADIQKSVNEATTNWQSKIKNQPE